MTAGATHHQLKCRKAVWKPSSSEVLDESAHSTKMASAKPKTMRSVGHARRSNRRRRRRAAGTVGSPGAVPSIDSAAATDQLLVGARADGEDRLGGPGPGPGLSGLPGWRAIRARRR